MIFYLSLQRDSTDNAFSPQGHRDTGKPSEKTNLKDQWNAIA